MTDEQHAGTRAPETQREGEPAPPEPMRPEKAEAAEAATRPRAEEEAGAPPQVAPRLAAGIELIGEYKESGFKVPPYIARRADGQTIQMPKLLYLVAEEVDGRKEYGAIAERVTEKFGRDVSADNIRVLVEEKLRPLGVVTQADGSSPELQKSDPMLALKFRASLVSDEATRRITTLFLPFFWPPVILAALAGLVAVDIWFFFFHGVGGPMRELVYNPVLLLMVLALVVVATALHEIGHATAARYGGAKPGVMGAGVYIVWPAFYTDVTDAYRLDRKGRLRVDLGGVYFNVLFILAITGAYFVTGFEPLLILIVVQHMQVIQQFLPFLRLDGYYILSDLTGVPDLFARLKPTLRSMLPSQEEDKRAGELKPWVRVVVTAWVVTLVPVLLFMFGVMVFNAPRIFATAWDSFFVHFDKASDAFGKGSVLGGIGSSVQMATLAVPAVGIGATLGRGGKHMLTGAWSWSEGSAARRALVGGVTALLAGVLVFVWWPNGEYRPIQPGEKGTLTGALDQFDELPSGRPGLTPARQDQLGGAAFYSEGDAADVDPLRDPPPTGGAGGDAPAEEPGDPAETGPVDDGGNDEDGGGEEPAPSETGTEPTETAPTTETPTETTETTP
jgi:putative peptide zinc metalloprotease protein